MVCFLFVLGVIAIGVWAWIAADRNETADRLAVMKSRQKRRIALGRAISQQPDFTPKMSLFSIDFKSGIAIDDDRRRVCLFNEIGEEEGKPCYGFRVGSYEDILKSEIVETANLLATTSRSNTLSRAVIGGMLAGEAGAVIGGLSGPTTTRQTKNVQQLDLRITVNDPSEPIHTLRLLGRAANIYADSSHYKTTLEAASLWHGRMNVIIHQGAQRRMEQSQRGEATKSVWRSQVSSLMHEELPQDSTDGQPRGYKSGDRTLAVRFGSDLETNEQAMENAGSTISPLSGDELASKDYEKTIKKTRPGVWAPRVTLFATLLIVIFPLLAIAVARTGSTPISASDSPSETPPQQQPSISQDRSETPERPDGESQTRNDNALRARIASDDVMRVAVAKSTKPEMQLTLEQAFGVYEKSLQANTHGNGLAEDRKQAVIEKEANQFSDLFSTNIILQGWIVEVYSVDPVHTIGKISAADLSCKVFYGSNCSVACSIIVAGAKNLEVATNLKAGDLIRFSGHTTRVVRPFGKNNLWSRFEFDVAADEIALIRSYKE